MTTLKSLFFLVFVPGLFVGCIPLTFLFSGPHIETSILADLAFPLWLVGGFMILWCFWDFLIKGHGTPAPIDPPKELVVSGLYRFVHNPMYVGVMLMLVGHILWFGGLWLSIYAVFFFVAFHLFVTFYEEPDLQKRLGDSYEAYSESVPRWIPKFK